MSSETITVDPRDAAVPVDASHQCSSCHVTALTSERYQQWSDYLDAHPQGTFFHTLAWRDAVSEAFGHQDLYLTAIGGDRVVGILPMFLVESRIAGRMLVSVPYGVGGGIIADSPAIASALFTAATRIANVRRCRSIDLRSERAAIPELPRVDRYVGFHRELPTSVEEVLARLPRKARAAARNARNKYCLTLSVDDEHLAEVWRLYSLSMRRLASITYPLSFFERLLAFTPDRHWVSLVKWNGRAVAGLVTFLFRDRVMPYFIGTSDEAKQCSAANFIYLTTMERGVEHGYRVFDFGRSRRDNPGSYNFKRFQGFEARPLEYQVYTSPGAQAPRLSPTDPRFSFARRLWPMLPLSVTRALGARLARHIPG